MWNPLFRLLETSQVSKDWFVHHRTLAAWILREGEGGITWQTHAIFWEIAQNPKFWLCDDVSSSHFHFYQDSTRFLSRCCKVQSFGNLWWEFHSIFLTIEVESDCFAADFSLLNFLRRSDLELNVCFMWRRACFVWV